MRTATTTRSREGKPTVSLSTLLFFLVAVVLFVVAAYYSSTIEKDIRLFKQVQPFWLVAAVAGQLLTYTFAALVYHELLRLFKKGRLLSVWELFQATVVTLFLNQAIPSEGVSGNTFIFHSLARRRMPVPQILSLIVLELLSFYAAMECVILVLLGLTMAHLPVSMVVVLAAGVVVYALFGGGLVLVGRKKAISALHRRLMRLRVVKRLAGKLKEPLPGDTTVASAENPQLLVKKNKGLAVKAVVFQVGVLAADALTVFALFQGLGAPLPIGAVLVGFILTQIVSLLPIAPGALILYESSMTYFYAMLGAPVSAAIIVTLLYRLLSFWLPMPFGLVLYHRLQRSD